MQSDFIKKGVERAPNRSLLYALGFTDEEIRRPIIAGPRWSSLPSPCVTALPWGTSA